MTERVTRLTETLNQAGIPISGASWDGTSCRVCYLPSATDLQKAQAQAILAAWDWTPTTMTPMSKLIDQLAALPDPALKQLALAAIARFIQEHPYYAKDKLGLDIVGEQKAV